MLKHNITIVNKITQLEELAKSIETISEEWDLPMTISMNLNLVLEELVTNIIFYGYDDSTEHEINIRMSFSDRAIEMQIEDDGKEFNPLFYKEPNIDGTIEERKIGGLGIFFVRKIMDNITYQRINNKNVLTLLKNIA